MLPKNIIKVSGKTVNLMERVHVYIQLEINMLENSKKVAFMEKELLLGKKEQHTLVIIKIVKCTEKELLRFQMELLKKAYLKMIN